MSSVIMQFPKPHLRCSAAATTGGLPERRSSPIERRSGGYKPTLWDFDTIQSLNTNYNEEMHQKRATALIDQVKRVLMHEEEVDHVRSLELIDDLQRLGISCHFDDEISQILNSSHFNQKYGKDLYSTALGFRLLRQHGFNVSQDVFDRFKNEKGSDFKASLYDDTNGLLQLYEASFLSTQGEDSTLELARTFATKFLHQKLDNHQIDDDNLLSSVRDALKFPIHWKVEILNARLFIDAYKRRPGMDPIVLELAQLDTNIVQAQLQQELKEASRWWNNTGLAQQLPFVRDRIVECYCWTIGSRQHGFERIMLTKVFALVTVIDDIFDIYGTPEELQLFTTAVQRWDTESMKQLPHYMQLCYLALYNFVNESAYDTLKERGFNPIPYLHNAWVDLVEAYMREAEWYYNGHKPSMEDYTNNAWMSIGGLPVTKHLLFRLINSISIQEKNNIVEKMHKYNDMVRAVSTVARLADDLGTSLDEVERGDVPKSVECYMNEKDCSEEEAREQVKRVIEQSWKTINKEMMMMKSSSAAAADDSPFSKNYVEALADMARTAQFIYQEDSDGFGMQHSKVKKLVKELLFDPYTY